MANAKYTVTAEGGNTRGYVKSIVIDTIDELANLPTTIASGSEVLVLATSQVFIRSNSDEEGHIWIEL